GPAAPIDGAGLRDERAGVHVAEQRIVADWWARLAFRHGSYHTKTDVRVSASGGHVGFALTDMRVLLEVLPDVQERRHAFADSGRQLLGRAEADVAGGEHAGERCLEDFIGDDKAGVIERDRSLEEPRVRIEADEYKGRGRVEGLALAARPVPGDHLAQLAVFRLQLR